jgi:cell division protease FtsH
VCAAVLPHADDLHKVTILAMGMALGVTQQLPEERHLYRQDYIEDRLVVSLGGRIAEEQVFGVISTGAGNDLEVATELSRKMVRQWGMSKRIGPMAWGSQNQVFLGDDLMHSRDYSDETARIIDEEVERILREQEDRCRETLSTYRPALDAVAAALLEKETIRGADVLEIITEALGAPPPDKIRMRREDEDELAVSVAGPGGPGPVGGITDLADGEPDLLG